MKKFCCLRGTANDPCLDSRIYFQWGPDGEWPARTAAVPSDGAVPAGIALLEPDNAGTEETMKGSDIRKIASDFEADEMGVDRFSTAMRRKLTRKRQEGRGGWQFPDECPLEDLRTMLKEHIAKGDPVDIANFAMMIWNREYPNGI